MTKPATIAYTTRAMRKHGDRAQQRRAMVDAAVDFSMNELRRMRVREENTVRFLHPVLGQVEVVDFTHALVELVPENSPLIQIILSSAGITH